MAVEVLEVHPAAATPVVELAVLEAPRRAAVGKAGVLDAAKDGVELLVADVERVVLDRRRLVLVEQERQRLIYPHMPEVVALAIEGEAEQVGEEACRGDLV